MRSLISMFFVLIVLGPKTGQAQSSNELESLFSFSSAMLNHLHTKMDSVKKIENSELKIIKSSRAKDSVIYTITYRTENNYLNVVCRYDGVVLSTTTNDVVEKNCLFKYSARKTFVKNGYYSNYLVCREDNPDSNWFPKKDEKINPNVEAINVLIVRVETQCIEI